MTETIRELFERVHGYPAEMYAPVTRLPESRDMYSDLAWSVATRLDELQPGDDNIPLLQQALAFLQRAEKYAEYALSAAGEPVGVREDEDWDETFEEDKR